MSSSFPVIPGAEAWSFIGRGDAARIGVVLVHGFTGNPYSLRPLAELLAKRGFAIELVRLPGHGTHWRDMMQTRYADWRREVDRSVSVARARSEFVVPVGLSMGGTLVLDVTSERQEDVAGVVAINPQILDREGVLVGLAPLLEKVVPFVPPKAAGLTKDDIAKPGMTENAYGVVPTACGNSLLKELPRVRRQLGDIKCPALVAYSRQDHSVSPDNARAVMRSLGSKSVTELVLERSYHVATLDYDLDLLDERIAGFAERIARERETQNGAAAHA